MYLYPLFSGSTGNVTLVDAGQYILVDAGKSAKAIAAALSVYDIKLSDISAVLVTHEHIDHVSGIGVLARRYKIPIYANRHTWASIPRSVGEIPDEYRRIITTGESFMLGGAKVSPFAIYHDAAEPVGYSIEYEGQKLTLMTDTGHMDERLIQQASGSDLLLIEANHDPAMVQVSSYPYPLKQRILSDKGHLSNDACAAALCRLYETGVKRVILGHLSRENNLESLALETVKCELRRHGITEQDMSLYAAHYDRVTGRFGSE